mmetsp:Transcript_62433/g.111552  ORF Transcript_62433/g.111552 Transcript_62433/m.111552 type:complete len:85 (+) Transcript_62433:145-399(+)
MTSDSTADWQRYTATDMAIDHFQYGRKHAIPCLFKIIARKISLLIRLRTGSDTLPQILPSITFHKRQGIVCHILSKIVTRKNDK